MRNSVEITLDQLKVVPFFDATVWTPARGLSSLSFFVKGEWHCWIGTPERLHKVKMWPSEADYFGDKPERVTDQCFRFFHLTAQRASFPEMWRSSKGIWNDFQNLATSLAKVQLFYDTSKSTGLETTRFLQTEIEYIVLVCRSVFDLLQEMIASIWQRVELLDRTIKKRQLPKSFADMLFHANELQTANDISMKYGLPIVLADWYVAQAQFFVSLRKLRDETAHGGNNPVEALFKTERGFAIRRDEKPWCEFYDWPKEVELTNRLVPVRPVLCAIIRNVIVATDSFAEVLEKTIELPGEIFPGLMFISRGYCDRVFHEMGSVLEHSWWCDTHIEIGPVPSVIQPVDGTILGAAD